MRSELRSLGERVEGLLSWLRDTEAQMGDIEGLSGKGSSPEQLTQRLQLCKVSLSHPIHTVFMSLIITQCLSVSAPFSSFPVYS